MSRRFAVSDPHGCRRTFASLLARLRLQRGDTLYVIGDLIDRGPDSAGLIDDILALRRLGLAIVCVRGNHEQMLLDAYDEVARYGWPLSHQQLAAGAVGAWRSYGGLRTLDSMAANHPGEVPERYLEFCRSLPLVVELDDLVLVHGALDFATADPVHDSGSYWTLWQRDLAGFSRELIGGRRLVRGHTPQSVDEIAARLAEPHWGDVVIDNGCELALTPAFAGINTVGSLLALNLDDFTFITQPCCG